MKRRRNALAKTRANRRREIETESYFAAMETTRPRYTDLDPYELGIESRRAAHILRKYEGKSDVEVAKALGLDPRDPGIIAEINALRSDFYRTNSRTPARRKNRHPIKVRKNFVVATALAVPILLGGISVAALLALKNKAASMVSLPAVAGAGVGFLAAKKYKQDVPTQVAAAALGYVGGLMLTKYMTKEKEEAVKVAYADNVRWYNPFSWFAA
jgi:hypothetical protein